jgi:molybdenum cofactor biosynthesis enzyme MoaA
MIQLINSCDKIYDSLDVRFTKNCDNNCDFCIEKKGIDAFNQNVNEMIDSTIKSGIKNVLIVGGEPFLYPEKLFKYISAIRGHVNSIYLTTSLPKTVFIKDEYVFNSINMLDGLNVSIQHYNWIENNNILNSSSKHNRINILKELLQNFSSKIRVSINLTKNGIDSKEKLLECLTLFKKIGVKNVKINEIQNNSEIYVSYEKIMNIKLKNPYSNGCQTKDSIFGLNITIKRSCFIVENSLSFNFKDLLKMIYKRFFYKSNNKFKVLYENGLITNKWRIKNV